MRRWCMAAIRIYSLIRIMKASSRFMFPLKNATFAFQPDWPALTGLNIDLNFINNGLWMRADKAMLGNVTASNLDAANPGLCAGKTAD
ncbi:membrane protein [Klebsiella pneumoniae]|nr:membrane protein [Klebsiella pneumoniae]